MNYGDATGDLPGSVSGNTCTGPAHTYVWKTDKAWASTCRELSLKLVDGQVHTTTFNFTK